MHNRRLSYCNERKVSKSYKRTVRRIRDQGGLRFKSSFPEQ